MTFALRFLSWIFGGLSLLNLVEDLSPIRLYGKLEKWSDAYSYFIDRIRNALFGWIDFGWISINQLEAHLIVVSSIMSVALARAFIRNEKTNPPPEGVKVWRLNLLIYMLSILPSPVLALLLPSTFGASGCILVIFFMAIIGFNVLNINWGEDGGGTEVVMSDEMKWKISPSYKEIRQELLAVVVFFILVIVINYAYFKP